jgi:hypothetical protein
MRIAPPCHLLTATTPQNPTIHYKTLRYATKQSAYDTHFFLDILRVMCYRSVVIGEGYVTSQRLYDMKKELYNIAFDTLTTPDVERWDYDTRKIVCEAVTPIIQEETKKYVEKPMAALHGIVKKLVNNRDVLDNEDNIRKLRFAYNGLAFALGYKLEGKKSYPIVEDSDYYNV